MKKIVILIMLAALAGHAAPKRSESIITIKAVGDIVPGTLYPEKRVPADPYEDIFAPIQQYLSGADILFGNFESTLTDYPKTSKNTSSKHVFAFRTPPSTAKVLKRAGFGVLSTANNHSGDFGERGFNDTMQNLKDAGILAVGRKGQIGYSKAGGKRVAFIAFSYFRKHNYIHDLAEMRALVSRAREQAEIVVISCHWGGEGEKFLHTRKETETFFGENRGNLPLFAHAAIDAGADLILGHGPHVVRALELYKSRLIVYSLGNFIGYGALSSRGKTGLTLVLDVNLDSTGKFLSGKIHPMNMPEKSLPRYDASGRTIELMRSLTQKDFPHTRLEIGADGNITVK
ncbi:CapA family protein [Turneriella parva]|uniref:Capsule synthesis protein, CapA n=1 Tax=Turneriella parva (strain ATCC BAA-1111 / DSM 21527 / NCTC 11395 / H) TaxID=869212 RepID=I4B8L7_TURPD|nr:CapA family protein [Turneriella parva]AFM13624.1 Capsule synthesis protein, CapA [Turneriella parva DSM 21527]